MPTQGQHDGQHCTKHQLLLLLMLVAWEGEKEVICVGGRVRKGFTDYTLGGEGRQLWEGEKLRRMGHFSFNQRCW